MLMHLFYLPPCRCTVVLLNPRKNKQTHLLNAGKKAISCLSFSSDGRYLATGETGHMPSVRVWDLQDRIQVAEFTGHKYAINCVVSQDSLWIHVPFLESAIHLAHLSLLHCRHSPPHRNM